MPVLFDVAIREPGVAEADRAMSPPAAPLSPAPESVAPPKRICSACYLTEEELNRTGLLGCPRCYETFAPIIATAVEVLHGVHVPREWTEPKPRRTVTNPWPTRRGIRL